jgi:Glycosyl hydrolase family 76
MARCIPLTLALLAAACLASPAQAAKKLTPTQKTYLRQAEHGVAKAHRYWWDSRRHWYRDRRGSRSDHPLATIWGIVPLFEAVNAIQIASPSPRHRAAVRKFVRGAERYWNPRMRPHPGYAAYPGYRRAGGRIWFDDNGWWGLAFFDAYRATHSRRALAASRRALSFIMKAGWDRRHGGIWWNNMRKFKAGESLASTTLLASLLYKKLHRRSYLRLAQRLIAWGDDDMWNERRGLYGARDTNDAPMPYVEGPMIVAHQTLCETTGVQAYCIRADQLAASALGFFGYRMAMGPQFDAVYVHWMLEYYAHGGGSTWYGLGTKVASDAMANSRNGKGVFTRAWDGSSMFKHGARPGMLRTHAASVSVLAWLATVKPPA